MTGRTAISAAVMAAAIGIAVSPALAAGSRNLGAFKEWAAEQFAEKKGRVCYMHSRPVKSAGKYTKRGDTYIQVTHRTSDGTRNEVSVTAGYTYRKGSEVKLIIDGTSFSLFTADDTAWGADSSVDNALVAAMKAGAKMIVKGTSVHGTLTTDTYSLDGFTAAHKAIDKACKVK